MAIIIKPPVSGGGGGGAVDSVNGQTGVVVLTTDNIAEGSNADRQYFTSADQGNVSTSYLQFEFDEGKYPCKKIQGVFGIPFRKLPRTLRWKTSGIGLHVGH